MASSSCPSCGVHASACCRGTEETPEHDSALPRCRRGKKFTGGETIDLQSLRETICDALRETASALLDTGGLWRAYAWYLEIPRPSPGPTDT